MEGKKNEKRNEESVREHYSHFELKRKSIKKRQRKKEKKKFSLSSRSNEKKKKKKKHAG